MHRSICLAGLLLVSICASAAPPPCPAGMPIGNIRLEVRRTPEAPPLPLTSINNLEEGDRVLYSPVLRANEKRRGEVALVLVAAIPQADQKHPFVILEPKDAKKPAEWTVPFRASLAVYVYGPDGISTRKLTGFLSRDDQLIAQLADYAEKTAQTETLLQAISAYERSGSSENLSAALEGFASRYGVSGKIDRNAPLEEQTMTLFRNLNPALAAYDPISPPGAQRVGQTASLATTVAGMFLGSTVGLAAGSAAMGLNLKAILMPNTEFRSAFSPTGSMQATSLCGRREPAQGRSRLAYLWAMRIPASGPPSMSIEEPNYLPAGIKAGIKVSMTPAHWKLAPRARDWTLRGQEGEYRPPVNISPTTGEIEVDLSKVQIPPGSYVLSARWDWDEFQAGGEVYVRPLSSFTEVRPTALSKNRLRPRSGKQLITLEGDDFQFVRKVALVRKDDRYAQPVQLPFSLPHGYRRGPQNTLETQVDTTPLEVGEYSLLLYQKESEPQATTVQVVPDPPKIEGLPVRAHLGEERQEVKLTGENLDRVSGLKADGLEIELGEASGDGRSRVARLRFTGKLERGATLPVRMEVKDYGEPIVLENAVRIAPPRPRILEMKAAPPSGLDTSVKKDELPAGLQTSVLLRVEPQQQNATLHLGCSNTETASVSVSAGMQKDGLRLGEVERGSLFLSFDPGMWPNGCEVSVQVEFPEEGRSDRRKLGRVVRLPKIETFQLTSEAAGNGTYYGILTGRGLELIERTGWDAKNGVETPGLPAPIAGEADRQTLRIRMPWPSPSPKAPLFVWLRGEQEGRQTGVTY